MTAESPDTTDRLAEIAARLDAATPGPWSRFGRNSDNEDGDDHFLGHDIEGPAPATRGQFVRVADAELIAHAPDDLAFLLAENTALRARLDTAEAGLRELASLQDRIPDDQNGDWGLGWDCGYNAAFADVRLIAASTVARLGGEGSR